MSTIAGRVQTRRNLVKIAAALFVKVNFSAVFYGAGVHLLYFI